MQQFTREERETAITYSLNSRFERIMKETMVGWEMLSAIPNKIRNTIVRRQKMMES